MENTIRIISFLIYRLKKDSFKEYLHNFIEKAGSCPAVSEHLSEWFDALKDKFAEAMRLHAITAKSQLTELMSLTDRQRDGIVTGIKHIVMAYEKSTIGEERDAARVLMVGLSSVKLNINNQYIEQTGQVDTLLEFLEREKESVEKLCIGESVETLAVVNNRMHELINGRVDEVNDKNLGAYARAREAAEESYRLFIDSTNAWALINSRRLDEGGNADGAKLTLREFMHWANSNIEFYNRTVLKIPASQTEQEVEDAEGDDKPSSPDGQVTLTFEKADETVIRLTGLTGESYEIPELLPEHIWVKADGEIEAPTGIFPAGDCTYIEVALGERKGAFYHYLSGEHETFYGLPGTEYTVPQIPEGCKWMPEPTGQIPEEDTQYFETLVPEGGSEESDGSEDSDGSEEKPDTPPAGEEKPKYTVNWINKDGETVKTMQVEAGTKLTSSDYPKASSGYIWKPSWIGGGLTINGDTTIREELDDDLGV